MSYSIGVIKGFHSFGAAANAAAKLGINPAHVRESDDDRALRILDTLTDPSRNLTPEHRGRLTSLLLH
jgi:hypothetical protein